MGSSFPSSPNMGYEEILINSNTLDMSVVRDPSLMLSPTRFLTITLMIWSRLLYTLVSLCCKRFIMCH